MRHLSAAVSAEAGVNPADIPGHWPRCGRATKADAMGLCELCAESWQRQHRLRKLMHTPRELAPNEERVRMTRLRQTIARRLKEAQDTAAMLTTFNDVDMGADHGRCEKNTRKASLISTV